MPVLYSVVPVRSETAECSVVSKNTYPAAPENTVDFVTASGRCDDLEQIIGGASIVKEVAFRGAAMNLCLSPIPQDPTDIEGYTSFRPQGHTGKDIPGHNPQFHD